MMWLSLVVGLVWIDPLWISCVRFPMQLFPCWQVDIFFCTWSKVWNRSIAIRTCTRVNRLGSRLESYIFLLILKSTNQVDALLDRSHRCNLVVNLHRLKEILLRLTTKPWISSHHWLIEEFTLRPEPLLIAPTFHDNEIICPPLSKFEVFLCRWKCSWLSFDYRCSGFT